MGMFDGLSNIFHGIGHFVSGLTGGDNSDEELRKQQQRQQQAQAPAPAPVSGRPTIAPRRPYPATR